MVTNVPPTPKGLLPRFLPVEPAVPGAEDEGEERADERVDLAIEYVIVTLFTKEK